jgi:hypothetical protein
MRENANNTRSKFSSWKNTDPKHIADEIKSRRLYNENRGTRFDSDTVVVKNKHGDCGCAQDPSEPKHMAQSTMGLFGSSSSKGGNGKSSSSFFKRLVEDAEAGRNPYGSNGAGGQSGSSSWVKGMSSEVPADKRASLEKHLKWMAKFEGNGQQGVQQQAPAQVMVPPPQPLQQMPSVFPISQMMPVQSSSLSMQPMGQVIDNIVSNQQAPAALSREGLQNPISQPASGEVFRAMKNRVAALLLHDLPPEVTAELRQIARELDQLNSSMT